MEAAAQEAKNAVRLTRLQYSSGVGDFLNVLDAQRTQLSLEEALARSETYTVSAFIAVYKALGGGVEG